MNLLPTLTLTTLFLSVNLHATEANDRPEKPNIIILLADDLGWQDVKCYDIDGPSPMETPNMDKLAKKGILFWQGYSPAAVCAPSRAAILSGKHPIKGEMTSVPGGFPPQPYKPTAALIPPYFTARIPVSTYTIAEALKDNGYTTGHSGKWHVSRNHYAYPNPFKHGFDYSFHARGVQSTDIKPDRLSGFATNKANDPYKLDENGFPYDSPQNGAMTFLKENHDKPFFLYYATWLVHTPIIMRSEKLLRKYEQKLGVKITEKHKKTWDQKGQTNPFYCAMVEQLDYYFGQVIDYLETTEDPRWPGHMLSENTFIFLSSDNGGMEGGRKTIITDNYPLDHGKASSKEGGIRVPFIVAGPNIPQGKQSNVMVNGLDFYPTILSLTGSKVPTDKKFDGCDISPLLTSDNGSDANLVKHDDGTVRNSMMWHFPQKQISSCIRIGDYKLIRFYDGYHGNKTELYKLYDGVDKNGTPVRTDIEERKDLAKKMPEKVAELDAELTKRISSMGGRLPYFNPNSKHKLKGKSNAPTVTSSSRDGNIVQAQFKNNGSKVVLADVLYTTNGGTKDEEWLRLSAEIKDNSVSAELPEDATHYIFNLIDENHFLVSDPVFNQPLGKKSPKQFSDLAHPTNKKAKKNKQ